MSVETTLSMDTTPSIETTPAVETTMSEETTLNEETSLSTQIYSRNATIAEKNIPILFTADYNKFLTKVENITVQPSNKNVPVLENRFPTDAIATLAGGGIG